MPLFCMLDAGALDSSLQNTLFAISCACNLMPAPGLYFLSLLYFKRVQPWFGCSAGMVHKWCSLLKFTGCRDDILLAVVQSLSLNVL